METLLCHSGMFAGTVGALALMVASAGGIGVLAATAFRRVTRRS